MASENSASSMKTTLREVILNFLLKLIVKRERPPGV
jgi:hypothetical protein